MEEDLLEKIARYEKIIIGLADELIRLRGEYERAINRYGDYGSPIVNYDAPKGELDIDLENPFRDGIF